MSENMYTNPEEAVVALKNENEKLNGRLKKAIQVFGEQKANIERLTAEKTELTNTLEAKTARIAELEATLKEKEKDDNKFF